VTHHPITTNPTSQSTHRLQHDSQTHHRSTSQTSYQPDQLPATTKDQEQNSVPMHHDQTDRQKPQSRHDGLTLESAGLDLEGSDSMC
jgi:hypothetical protein